MKKRIKDLTEEEIERLPDKDFIIITNYNGRKARIFKTFILTSLYGTIDIPDKHILDKEEHDYLRAVCKPFKIMSIEKKDYKAYQQIEFFYNKSGKSYSTFSLPPFKKGSMYKGMKPFKQYSIAYLELDKEWEE